MKHSLEPMRFRFQEDLALHHSLYPISKVVLEHALKVSGANSGVFLYAAPGSAFFEKVATTGLTETEDANWSHCERGSNLPLPESMRSQKFIEIGSEDEVTLMAFPLSDSGMTNAGFSISFRPGQAVDKEIRDFLFWLASRAEHALFNHEGEGV